MTRAWGAWQRFWFEPRPVSTLVLFRIAYGTIVFLWALSALPDAAALFSRDGVVPASPHIAGAWSLLHIWDGRTAAVAVVGVLALAALCVVAGRWTRLAAVVVFVCFVSLGTRNPYVGNAGDALLRTLSLYLMLAPSGAAVSLDRRRAGRERFWEIPRRAPWALRLIQVQISLLYVSTVWAKLRGDLWPHGKAVAYALRLDDLSRFPVPDVGRWLLVTNVMTWSVLAIELSLGILVWRGLLRPWVLAAGVCLHLGIEYRLRVGFFSWAILASYIAFIPEATAARIIGWGRSRMETTRLGRAGSEGGVCCVVVDAERRQGSDYEPFRGFV